MACPTCDHTMELLHSPGTDCEPRIFQCPRCGTTKKTTLVLARDGHGGKSVADVSEVVFVPKLVERCREFEGWMSSQGKDLRRFYPEGIREELHRLGIAESINLPGDRK